MISHIVRRHDSLNKITAQNALELYLLNKNKKHKLSLTHHTRPSVKKANNSEVDIPKDHKKLPKSHFLFNYSPADKQGHLDTSIDWQSSKNKNVQDKTTHKNPKSNKSLLNILLNHFHQEHRNQETQPDSEATFGHNLSSQTSSLFQSFRGTIHAKKHNRQKGDEHLQKIRKNSIEIDSIPNINMNLNLTCIKQTEQRCKLPKRPYHPISPHECKDQSIDNRLRKRKNILVEHHNTEYIDSQTYMIKKEQRKHIQYLSKIKTLCKQNKIQRTSDKAHNKFAKLTYYQADDNGVNPWSTAVIKGQTQELFGSQDSKI